MLRTARFVTIELPITAQITTAGQKIFFQSQPQLQSIMGDQQVWVKGLQTFDNTALTHSPITNANPLATGAQLANAVLTLDVQGTLVFEYIPLAMLNRNLTDQANYAPGQWDLFLLKNIFKINWTKSYVTVVAAPSGQPFSYLFGVHYDYVPDQLDVNAGLPMS